MVHKDLSGRKLRAGRKVVMSDARSSACGPLHGGIVGFLTPSLFLRGERPLRDKKKAWLGSHA